jgi:hypothetical protein
MTSFYSPQIDKNFTTSNRLPNHRQPTYRKTTENIWLLFAWTKQPLPAPIIQRESKASRLPNYFPLASVYACTLLGANNKRPPPTFAKNATIL